MSEVIRNRIKARLVPRRDKSEIGGLSIRRPSAEVLATRAAALSADGTVRFSHVRPDRYRLIIDGRGISETVLALDVPGAGLDVGDLRIDAPSRDRPHRGPRVAPEVQRRGCVGIRQGLRRRVPI